MFLSRSCYPVILHLRTSRLNLNKRLSDIKVKEINYLLLPIVTGVHIDVA